MLLKYNLGISNLLANLMSCRFFKLMSCRYAKPNYISYSVTDDESIHSYTTLVVINYMLFNMPLNNSC